MPHLRHLVVVLLELVFVFCLFHSVQAYPFGPPGKLTDHKASVPRETPYSSTTLLVKFKPTARAKLHGNNPKDTGVPSINAKLEKHKAAGFNRIARDHKNAKTNSELFGWYQVSLDPNQGRAAVQVGGQTVYPDLEELEGELKNDDSVEAVTKDYIITSSVVPNDPYYSSTGAWGQAFEDLWGLKKINAATAWDTTTGSSSIIAAVIDTGVDKNHADISANIWTNPGESGNTQAGGRCWTGTVQNKATNACDDDNNGFIDDVNGWNFVSNNNNVLDDDGHGTHVAGTIAGVGNNSTGIVGVSWNTKIMPIKVLDGSGSGTLSNAALALQYAADNGAKVSNNSYSCACNSTLEEDAIKYEHDRNVTTVVAAGNAAADSLNYSPSNGDGAIVVGATSSTDAIASFSNTGAKVDVTAPGVDILSLKSSLASSSCTGGAVVNANYCHISGTSMATPHVAGLVSLMLAVNSSLTPEQIRQILRTTGQDLGAVGHDNTFGFGRIKADTAVAASASPTVLTPYITSPSSRKAVSGTSVAVNGTANGATFKNYKVEIGAGRTPSSWVALASSTTPVTNGTLATFNSTTFPDSTYTLRLTITDTSDKTYEYSIFDVQTDNFDQSIATPLDIMAIGTAKVEGIANAKNGSAFDHYTVEWGAGTSPSSYSTTGVTLTNGGTQAVPSSGSLATIDTSGFVDQQPYTVRLTVYSTSGTYASTTATAYAESRLVSGWPKYMPHTTCTDCDHAGAIFADLDGDGQKEVIMPANDKVYAFHKDGSGVAGWPVTVTSGDSFQTEAIAADLDGDLLPEIILSANTTSGTRRLYVIKSNGTLYPGWPKPTFWAVSGEDPNASIVDLDGDGSKELVMIALAEGTSGPKLYAYRLNGTQLTGFPKTVTPTGTRWVYEPPTISDLDNDGHPEIIYAEYSNLFVYNYQGILQANWTLPTTGGNINAHQGPPAVGDVDGDGIKEIIVNAQRAGSAGVPIQVFAYKPNGTLLPGWPYSVSGGSMSYWYLNTVATADVDSDGKDEVIVGQWGSAVIDDGTGPKAASAFNSRPAPSLADFDGDGNIKLFGNDFSSGTERWANTSNLGVYWSNAHFTSLLSDGPPAMTTPVGDLDDNGHQEFAMPLLHNSDSYIYLMEMPGTTHPKDSWPMFGHDPQRTGHYTVGQIVTDTTAPQVAITSPTNNASVSGSVSLTATAIDETDISKVEFYVDGNLVGTDTTFPYTASWNSSGAALGNHVVMAKAYDTSNNTATNSVTVIIPDTTPPSAPSNLSMTGNTDSSISFSWTASTDNVGVTGYRIYRNGTLVSTQAGTSFTDTGRAPSTLYTYGVEAYDAAGNNSSRTTANFSTTADATPPTVPSNLSATNITATGMRITWTASTDNVGVTGYEIYRGATLIGTSAATFFDDTGLQPTTNYTYTVKAYDARANHSTASAPLTRQTATDTTAPSTPSGLQALNVTYHTLKLSWTASTDNVGVTGYQVYQGATLLGTTASTTFDRAGLNPNTSYSFTIKAYDAAGNVSASSATFTTSTVKDITNPTITFSMPNDGAAVSNSIAVSANANDDDSMQSIVFTVDGVTKASSTSIINYTLDTKSLSNGPHTLSIIAIDASNNSVTSNRTIVVSNTIRKLGDVNRDGFVNIFDLSILLGKYNQNYVDADFDSNGTVNIFDLSTLLSHYGT